MPPILERATPREWIGLAVLALPTLLVSMDMTILYLALPSLSMELHPSGAQVLWISDVYAFVLAAVLIPMGALGDRIGRRKLLLWGAVGFCASSIFAGLASSAEQLILARALLGVCGATLLPSTLAMIRHMFLQPQERTLAIGIWATCFTLGGVLGPLLGGVLLSYFHWGSVFFVAVPIMLVLLLAGPALLPEIREPSSRKVDATSVVQLMLAVLAGTYAMKDAASHGVGWIPAMLLVVAVTLGAAFLRRQKSIASPLVQLALFRSTAFSTAMTANALALFAWVGASLLVAQHIQLVLGLRAMPAALWMLPSALACMAGCLAAPGLARSWWSGRIITVGLFLATLGLGVLAALAHRAGLAAIVPAMMMLGFGVSLIVTLSTDIILSEAPPEMAGSASSLSETAADLGGALGVAVLGSVGLAVYRLRMTLPSGMDSGQTASAMDGLSGAVHSAASMPAGTGAWLLEAARSAHGQGLGIATGVGAMLLLVMAFLSWSTIGCSLQQHAKFKGGNNA